MSLIRQTLRLATPAVAENLFSSALFLVDALMVIRLGPTALAATGLAGTVLWRVRQQMGVMQIGTGATVARRWGEGRHDEARKVFTHGTLLGFLAGVLCLPLIAIAGPAFTAMNAQPEVLTQLVPYFTAIMVVYPFRFASINMSTALRSAGDTRTPMLTTLFMNLSHVFFNYVFIYGKLGAPMLGVLGAGVGSAFAIMTEFLLLLAVGTMGVKLPKLATERGSDRATLMFDPAGFRLTLPGTTRSMMRLSWPSFWEEMAVTVGFLVFGAMIADLGVSAMAAHYSVTRIESFSFNIGFGISLAAAALVGQSIGAKDIATARRALSLTAVMGFASMGLMGIVFAAFPDQLLEPFYGENGGGDRSLMPLARLAFTIVALEQPFLGLAQVLSGGMRGAGYTVAPLISQLVGTVIVRIAMGYYLGFYLGWGLEGIYWATVMDWVFRALILSGLALSGRWERVRI